MGSQSDWATMKHAAEILDVLGVAHDSRIVSAHRTPKRLYDFAGGAKAEGIKVIIAGAGGAAHLPGAVAANCTLPVIGIPLASSEVAGGLDAIYGVLQMPPGVPVAGVAVGSWGARNAAYLAASILALKHPDIREAYKAFRDKQSQG